MNEEIKQIKLEETGVYTTTFDRLICPVCGGGDMHQNTVEIFNREKEDSDKGTYVKIDKDNVTTSDDANTNNPSPRRQGMYVHLDCECGVKLRLTIGQHKGSTFMGIEVTDRTTEFLMVGEPDDIDNYDDPFTTS